MGQLEVGIYNDDHEAASVEQPGITVSMAIKYSDFLGKQVLVTLMKMIWTRVMVLTTATGLTSTKPMMQSPKLTTIFTLSLYPFPELTNLSLPKTKCNFLQHYFINTRYKGTYQYGMAVTLYFPVSEVFKDEALSVSEVKVSCASYCRLGFH
jgi:hypothetical protein